MTDASSMTIRRATVADAAGVAEVMAVVTAERRYSAIDRAWSAEEEGRYLASLSSREAVHVAVAGAHAIVGFQTLDLWSPVLSSMAHVGQIGTYLLPEWRQRGVGRRLWSTTLAFAKEAGYLKLVVQIRGSNTAAQAFYQTLGFEPCGRMAGQVIIDGVEDDEVLMERRVA